MYIVEKQQLWYDNIMSYRTRVEEKDLPRLLTHVSNVLDALELKQKGDIVFTIDEKVKTERTTILGVELLIPIDRVFESSCRYVYKSCFKLENAVMSKFSGRICTLSVFAAELCSYVDSSNIKPITGVYYLVRSICNDDCILDLYVGTSGNIL